MSEDPLEPVSADLLEPPPELHPPTVMDFGTSGP